MMSQATPIRDTYVIYLGGSVEVQGEYLGGGSYGILKEDDGRYIDEYDQPDFLVYTDDLDLTDDDVTLSVKLMRQQYWSDISDWE